MSGLIDSHVTIIVGTREQIGRVNVAPQWYKHEPANAGRPFKTLSGIKRSLTNEWNRDNHRYIAVVDVMADGTYEAHVARVVE